LTFAKWIIVWRWEGACLFLPTKHLVAALYNGSVNGTAASRMHVCCSAWYWGHKKPRSSCSS
jgi:hypothetical protein